MTGGAAPGPPGTAGSLWTGSRRDVAADLESGRLPLVPSSSAAVAADVAALGDADRCLRPFKNELRKRQYGRTKPGTLLKHQIPLKTDRWDVQVPGLRRSTWSRTRATAARATSCIR
jgi:hypothetical protein